MNQVITTITPKFQVHIPSAIRLKIGLTKHGKAIVKTKGKDIIIRPVTSAVLGLGGKYKVKRAIPAEKIREHLQYI